MRLSRSLADRVTNTQQPTGAHTHTHPLTLFRVAELQRPTALVLAAVWPDRRSHAARLHPRSHPVIQSTEAHPHPLHRFSSSAPAASIQRHIHPVAFGSARRPVTASGQPPPSDNNIASPPAVTNQQSPSAKSKHSTCATACFCGPPSIPLQPRRPPSSPIASSQARSPPSRTGRLIRPRRCHALARTWPPSNHGPMAHFGSSIGHGHGLLDAGPPSNYGNKRACGPGGWGGCSLTATNPRTNAHPRPPHGRLLFKHPQPR